MVIVIISTFLLLSTVAVAAVSFAPWVPTWKKDLQRITALANLKSGEMFYDLGCGNGKVPLYVAQYTSAQAIGVELALPLYLFCRWRKWIRRVQQVTFTYGNLFNTNLTNANVVFVFGMPKRLTKKLKTKLLQELKPGARIISYCFPIAGLTPLEISKPTVTDIAIYLYRR